MGLDDEAFDKAFDQAYSQVSGEEVSAPDVKESPVSEEATDGASKPVKSLKDEVAEKEFIEKNLTPKKDGRKRGSDGKFTKEEATQEEAPDLDQVAEAEEQVNVAESETPAPSLVNPPARWSSEGKALFNKASPELQQFISARELETQQIISRVASEAERGKQLIQRLNSNFETPEAFERHKALMAADGIKDEVDELHRYRAWDSIIRSDVKGYITGLMRNNGLTPQDLLTDGNGYEEPYQDPRFDEVTNQLRQTQSTLEKLQRDKEEAENRSLMAEVDSFKAGKDSYGNTRKAFLEMYEPQIAHIVTQIRQANPGISRTDALNEGYEHVLREVRSIHGFTGAPQSAPKPVDANKAKQVSSSSNGAPKSGVANPKPKLKGKNFNDVFDDAYNQALETINTR